MSARETLTAAQQGLPVDLDGDHYRTDELGPWKVTPCCGAYAKGTEDGIVCRSCYADVPWEFYDGPARIIHTVTDVHGTAPCGCSRGRDHGR